jgi:hypothetical protein
MVASRTSLCLCHMGLVMPSSTPRLRLEGSVASDAKVRTTAGCCAVREESEVRVVQPQHQAKLMNKRLARCTNHISRDHKAPKHRHRMPRDMDQGLFSRLAPHSHATGIFRVAFLRLRTSSTTVSVDADATQCSARCGTYDGGLVLSPIRGIEANLREGCEGNHGCWKENRASLFRDSIER